VIWAEDFGSEKVLKTAEYFVYCGVFKTHLWGERFAQSPKGEFLEVPNNKSSQVGCCPPGTIMRFRAINRSVLRIR
ncbi:MAG: hypothetical protein IKC09_09620, partial [Oscillospiraceae bacterium]|nr:hypothetical protein [Oscillospiraceae bacterium]